VLWSYAPLSNRVTQLMREIGDSLAHVQIISQMSVTSPVDDAFDFSNRLKVEDQSRTRCGARDFPINWKSTTRSMGTFKSPSSFE
jgi:hypothetical protein